MKKNKEELVKNILKILEMNCICKNLKNKQDKGKEKIKKKEKELDKNY